MEDFDILSDEFAQAADAAWDSARERALANGQSVFYIDEDGLNILQQPDGRRFEIRFIAGAPRGKNFEILRELPAKAA